MHDSSDNIPKTVFTLRGKLVTRTKDGTFVPLRIHRARWRSLAVWCAAFTVIAFFGMHALRVNQDDIQSSRVSSCIKTYGSFDEVFKPFFPPPGKRSKEQRKNLAKLQARINVLQAHCKRQVDGG